MVRVLKSFIVCGPLRGQTLLGSFVLPRIPRMNTTLYYVLCENTTFLKATLFFPDTQPITMFIIKANDTKKYNDSTDQGMILNKSKF